MNILHLSALPVWSMEGKGGMPSLRETLRCHTAAEHTLHLILPRFDLFSDHLDEVVVRQGLVDEVEVAPCRWLRLLKKFRALAQRFTGKNVLPYPARWILNMAMLLLLTVSLFRAARRVTGRGFQPDLVYAHNQYAALAGFLVARFLGVPNVTRLYGTFLADLIQKPFVSLRYPTAAAGYRVPSNLLICANDGTRGDEVARAFNVSDSRFRFWQNGVDPPLSPPNLTRREIAERFNGALRLGSQWVVSCSRLSYWKRIDRMLHAVAVCKNCGGDCQLLIAGDGPERESLQPLAHRLGIADEAVFLGALAHDDIWALMNVADIFMITNDVTNRCNPLYEAAWAGLPVVSVVDSSTADLLQDGKNALLAEKDDVQAMGAKLLELCRNQALRNRMRKAQKELAASFWTWEERMRVETRELEALVANWKFDCARS